MGKGSSRPNTSFIRKKGALLRGRTLSREGRQEKSAKKGSRLRKWIGSYPEKKGV